MPAPRPVCRGSSTLAVSRLSEHGWVRTADADDADLVIFNTCSVRDHSENRVWSRLGALRERKARDPSLLIGVMVGTYSSVYVASPILLAWQRSKK